MVSCGPLGDWVCTTNGDEMGSNPLPRSIKPPYPWPSPPPKDGDDWFNNVLDQITDDDLRDRVLEAYGENLLNHGDFVPKELIDELRGTHLTHSHG